MHIQTGTVKSTSGAKPEGYKTEKGEWVSFYIPREDSEYLQEIKNKLFKIHKVKKGKLYQLNAHHAFRRALENSNGDHSEESLSAKFYIC